MLGCSGVASTPPAAVPKPGQLETYRDWTIGCDNRARCEAVALMPEGSDWSDEPVVMGVARDAGADADTQIWADHGRVGPRATLEFWVDGRKIASASATGDSTKLLGPQASALAIAMARGRTMEIRAGDRVIARPSLSGAAAALRYMDARQGRAGTITALIATGPLGRTAVRPAPAVPLVRRMAIAAAPAPAPLWREELANLGIVTGCAEEMKDGPAPEQHRLSKTETLVIVHCGSGAYNFTSVPMIATGVPGRRVFRHASFDFQPGWSEDPKKPMLVNAGWQPDQSRLTSFAKGRGLGDCGGAEDYVWDGVTFRLVEAQAMGECRGSSHWIITWSARVEG
ncbi:DUF1176 domain-containing protein [Sphingobium sp. AN641]|uniref:DUF1176 domain-containing protein n=1 Tax=Sphingobium sp. AN641 TaxID=3133443 RepID=UPI0030BF3E90